MAADLLADVVAEDAAWKARYRIPTFSVSGVAKGDPSRGVISTNKDGVGQIYSWDRATGAMVVKTDSPAGKGGGIPSKDGEYIFYHQDDKPGLEIGHYVAIKWDASAGPGDTVDLTPSLKSYAASGLVEAKDGSKLVLSAAVDGGQVIYVKDGGIAAEPVEYHRIDQLVQTGSLVLSPCGRYLAQSSNEHTLPDVAMDAALNIYDLTLPAGSAPIATLWDGPKTSMSGYSFVPEQEPPMMVVTTSASGFDRPVMWEPLSDTRTELPSLSLIEGQLTPVCFDESGGKLLLRQLHRAQVSLHLLDVASGAVSGMPEQPKGLFSSAFFDKLTGDLCVGFVNEATPAMVITLDASTGAPKAALLPADATLPPAGSAATAASSTSSNSPRSFESILFPSENGAYVQRGWIGRTCCCRLQLISAVDRSDPSAAAAAAAVTMPGLDRRRGPGLACAAWRGVRRSLAYNSAHTRRTDEHSDAELQPGGAGLARCRFRMVQRQLPRLDRVRTTNQPTKQPAPCCCVPSPHLNTRRPTQLSTCCCRWLAACV